MRAILTANDYTTSQTRQTRRFSRSCAYHPDSQQLLYLQTRQTRRFSRSYACHPDSQRLLYITNQTDKKVHPFICMPSWQPTTTLHHKPHRQEGSSIHMRAILTANDYSTSQTTQTRRFIHSYACHPDSQRLHYITNQTDKKVQAFICLPSWQPTTTLLTNQTDKKVHPFICVPFWQPTTTLHHKPDRQEGSSIHMRAILTANNYSTYKPDRQEGSSIHMRAILTANDYSTWQTRQTRRFIHSYACHPDSQRLHYITNQTDKKVQPFMWAPSWQPTTTRPQSSPEPVSPKQRTPQVPATPTLDALCWESPTNNLDRSIRRLMSRCTISQLTHYPVPGSS